jgi:predicted  nucleic acid-binding Zn-ribbon protein
VRKLEQEVEKLQNDVKTLEGKEERAREALAQQVNRAHMLEKECQEARREYAELLGITFCSNK